MWLFYVDESGSDSMATVQGKSGLMLKPGNSEWFVLSAVGIPDHCRITLAEQIRLVKDRAFANWRGRPWSESEVKGSYITHAAKQLALGDRPRKPQAYRGLSEPQLRLLCQDLGWVLRKYRPIVYVVAVDKRKLLENSKGGELPSVAGIAYTFLQQRLALLAEQVLGASECIAIVADEQTGHESEFRDGRLHEVREAFNKRIPSKPNFDLLLDKPVWVNARLSVTEREIIQLADVVAYAASMTCQTGRVPTEYYCMWDNIASCMALNWKTHRLPNGGFTIFPRPKTYPSGL